ncbi:MAG: hypothetical protein K2H65_00170, partial [Bacteroidales bacterium]|nr:hypothetical protein [Bacteroidales bacterium]
NPRTLTVTRDTTFTAIFAKDEDNPDNPDDPDNPDNPDTPDTPDTPDNPDNPDTPTANEAALTAAPFAYVQGRTAYLADGLGEVEAFTMTGQRVYRGTARTLTLPRPGIYVLRVVADGRRCKVVVK